MPRRAHRARGEVRRRHDAAHPRGHPYLLRPQHQAPGPRDALPTAPPPPSRLPSAHPADHDQDLSLSAALTAAPARGAQETGQTVPAEIARHQATQQKPGSFDNKPKRQQARPSAPPPRAPRPGGAPRLLSADAGGSRTPCSELLLSACLWAGAPAALFSVPPAGPALLRATSIHRFHSTGRAPARRFSTSTSTPLAAGAGAEPGRCCCGLRLARGHAARHCGQGGRGASSRTSGGAAGCVCWPTFREQAFCAHAHSAATSSSGWLAGHVSSESPYGLPCSL
jgi:hypothetical protein